MKKIKENKGITLIALIITIIVLLILAVVAISAVQGDGIIAYAKNARDDYKDAQDTENTVLGNYMIELNNANNSENLNKSEDELEFNKFGSTFIDSSKTSTYTFVKENNKIYTYIVDFRENNFTRLDLADKIEVIQLNVEQNINKINEYLDYYNEYFQISIDNNIAPTFFTTQEFISSNNMEEIDYLLFFNKDYTKLIDDGEEYEIGEFDYQSYFND